MNPARVKRAVNGLAERVVYIQWDEQPLPRRHDIDDYVQMQHCYDTCYDHLRKRCKVLRMIHHNAS